MKAHWVAVYFCLALFLSAVVYVPFHSHWHPSGFVFGAWLILSGPAYLFGAAVDGICRESLSDKATFIVTSVALVGYFLVLLAPGLLYLLRRSTIYLWLQGALFALHSGIVLVGFYAR